MEFIKLIQRSDQAFRIGGDEFVIITSETKLKGAEKLGEKLRQTIKENGSTDECSVTISVGVADLGEYLSKEELFNRADQAL